MTSLEPERISSKTFLAPLILLSLSKGESSAFETAFIALFSPDDPAEPIIAFPLFDKTVLASFKSIFWV